MRKFLISLLWFCVLASESFAQSGRWTEQRAAEWYAQQPWLVGSNYIPATAINQLEMWQADTFDPQRIDLELGWAESIGLNAMRVFLHDLPWQQDAAGFRQRIDNFLSIAEKHHIKILFVLFDSCWDPNPHLGRQRQPRPGVHNSGWVQSPGAAALKDPAQLPRLEAYVKGVVAAFGNDPRVLAWDVWNEPGNTNQGSYGSEELPDKVDLVRELLPKVFTWAREAGASQPLTSGLWRGNWSSRKKLDAITRIQLEQSDVLSFHNYDAPREFRKRVNWLQSYHRPILCTEYMARPRHSTFAGILPIAKKCKVAAINWGLVAGKTQTWLPWDSWQHAYTNRQPKEWFHEIFRSDGQPYRQEEVDLIHGLTAPAAVSQ
ncbi:MAG TPA: cellulase family glycosylhydrolase [Candidatus Sulfotelmatobacter sp.]|nr:cellulase family glycosylhydrolase [Candidatus Sulfotelmatobacter sp.]